MCGGSLLRSNARRISRAFFFGSLPRRRPPRLRRVGGDMAGIQGRRVGLREMDAYGQHQ